MLISTYASSSLHEQPTVFSTQEKIRQLEIEISRLQKMLSATPMKLVCIPQGNRQVRVKVEHILFIRSESNYSRVFLKNGEVFFTSKTLKAWEGELRDSYFLRCHRS